MGAAAEDLSMELIGEGESFKNELCDMIENAQMFNDFQRSDTEIIARYARAYSAKQGSTIFKEGGKGSFMCLVVDGRVGHFQRVVDRRQKIAVETHIDDRADDLYDFALCLCHIASLSLTSQRWRH